MTRPPASPSLRGAAALLLAFAVWEGAAWTALQALKRLRGLEYEPMRFSLSPAQREVVEQMLVPASRHMLFDQALGWTARPGHRRGPYHVNAQGIRADRDYPAFAPRGRLRVAAFGDSFTHGSEVSNEHAWAERMGAKDRSVEVLNFGIGGYGLDQAFLRYRRSGAAFHPDLVFMGFTTENLARNVNVFQPFMFPGSKMVNAKPRFALQGDGLRFIENPMRRLEDYRLLLSDEERELRRLGAEDYFYRVHCRPGPFDGLASVRLFKLARAVAAQRFVRGDLLDGDVLNPRSEAFEVTARIFRDFARAVAANGSRPVAVFFPYVEEIQEYREREVTAYAPLMRRLEADGLCVIDLMGAFAGPGKDIPLERLFAEERHYSPLGNDLVADHLLAWLKSRREAGAGDRCPRIQSAPRAGK